MTETKGAQLEALVLKWANSLGTTLVAVSVADAYMERVIQLTPTQPGAASIELRIAEYGGCGLYAGEGFQIEELTGGAEVVLPICDPIREGMLEEWSWVWRGRSAVVLAALKSNGKAMQYLAIERWWLLPFFPKKKHVRYLAWAG